MKPILNEDSRSRRIAPISESGGLKDKALIQNQGNWVPDKLKRIYVEQRLFA